MKSWRKYVFDMNIPSANPSKWRGFEIIGFFRISPKIELSGTIVKRGTQETIRLDPCIPPISGYCPTINAVDVTLAKEGRQAVAT